MLMNSPFVSFVWSSQRMNLSCGGAWTLLRGTWESGQERESKDGWKGISSVTEITTSVGSRNFFISHQGFASNLPSSALFPGVCGFSPHQLLTAEKQTQNTPRACLPDMDSLLLLILISHDKLGVKLWRFIFPPPERWIKGLKLHQQIAPLLEWSGRKGVCAIPAGWQRLQGWSCFLNLCLIRAALIKTGSDTCRTLQKSMRAWRALETHREQPVPFQHPSPGSNNNYPIKCSCVWMIYVITEIM